MNTQFNDEKLVKLAKRAYYSLRGEKFTHLEPLLRKKTLSDQDRNNLLDLVDAGNNVRPLSISELKSEIFTLIGYKSLNAWGSTVSRTDLEAIHNYITANKK